MCRSWWSRLVGITGWLQVLFDFLGWSLDSYCSGMMHRPKSVANLCPDDVAFILTTAAVFVILLMLCPNSMWKSYMIFLTFIYHVFYESLSVSVGKVANIFTLELFYAKWLQSNNSKFDEKIQLFAFWMYMYFKCHFSFLVINPFHTRSFFFEVVHPIMIEWANSRNIDY